MSLAQRAMEHPLLAPVYQHVWRPAWWLGAVGFDVPHLLREKAKAVQALRLAPGASVLDVACGPGNFTGVYADAVGPDGLAVGLDLSRPMLRQAARSRTRTAGPSVPAYVEGSALTLPFADGGFDAVACYGALYLVPEPFAAVDEIVRVVRPGGRVAIMTTTAPDLLRGVARQVTRPSGLRIFGPDDITGRLRDAGFTEITRETHGVFQYVAGTAPTAS